MKRSVYNLVKIINEIYNATEKYPGKKKFQKLVYLIENIGGVDLGFKYEIHLYGPYSSGLEESVTILCGEGFLGYEYYDSSHLICIKEDITDDDFFSSDLTTAEYSKIKRVIKRFSHKTPGDLELLTTTHFMHSALKLHAENSIIAGVQKIKGTKFSENQIKNAIRELNLFAGSV